jgi:hypothetical protein
LKIRPPCQKDLRDEDLRVEKILEKNLKMKACAPSEANEPCHRSAERSQSPKVKTSGRTRHSKIDASGLRTCIG